MQVNSDECRQHAHGREPMGQDGQGGRVPVTEDVRMVWATGAPAGPHAQRRGRCSCAGDTWPFLWLFSEPHQEHTDPPPLPQSGQNLCGIWGQALLPFLPDGLWPVPEPSRSGLQNSMTNKIKRQCSSPATALWEQSPFPEDRAPGQKRMWTQGEDRRGLDRWVRLPSSHVEGVGVLGGDVYTGPGEAEHRWGAQSRKKKC